MRNITADIKKQQQQQQHNA